MSDAPMTNGEGTNRAVKRVSFDVRDAERIHEWAMALRQAQVECLMKDGGCFECLHVVERLEKFIGKKSVAWMNRQIKKHPYFPRNETGAQT